jgi:hypothetical protein
MKPICLLLLFCCACAANGQDIAHEIELENEAARGHALDDSFGNDMSDGAGTHSGLLRNYRRHPLNINTADADALHALGILSPIQLNSFLQYRKQLGALLSIYELQAVPNFDQEVIKRLLPYVTVEATHYSHKTGTQNIMSRYERQLNPPLDTHYLGSPDYVLLRYRYSAPGYMSTGMLLEKDAGEQAKNGFLSAHFFITNTKHVKALAIGDFTVNMGQGLLNWQAFSYNKGSAATSYKEGPVLRPYTSSGEVLFYRGLGVTLQKRNWQYTAFFSLRKPDGNLDSTGVSSLDNDGYHRTKTEVENAHVVTQFTTGGNISFVSDNGHAGVNFVHQQFSAPLLQKKAVYSQFMFAGKQLSGVSADYAFTLRNIYFFGEAAMSDNKNRKQFALLQGMLISIGKPADVVLVYRHYDKAYQAIYTHAFGEHEQATNETGLYMGLSVKLPKHWQLNTYADLFSFPWLQYRLNSPGNGRDLLASLSYTPDKRTSILIRYSQTNSMQDLSGSDYFMQPITHITQAHWRLQASLSATRELTFKIRAEKIVYSQGWQESNSQATQTVHQHGFLLLTEATWKKNKWRIQLQYARYLTDGSTTSLYVLSTGAGNVVTGLYGNGTQLQCTINYHITKSWLCSFYIVSAQHQKLQYVLQRTI